MPANETNQSFKPCCPYCGSEFEGSHSCQSSEKDNYYRGMKDDGDMTLPQVKQQREWDEQMAKDAKKDGWPYTPPWEREHNNQE